MCPAQDHNKLSLASKYSTKVTPSYLAQALHFSTTLRQRSEQIGLERLVPSDLISARLKRPTILRFLHLRPPIPLQLIQSPLQRRLDILVPKDAFFPAVLAELCPNALFDFGFEDGPRRVTGLRR